MPPLDGGDELADELFHHVVLFDVRAVLDLVAIVREAL